MKILKFLFALIVTSTMFFYLNKQNGNIPPLGKFMDPFGGFWQNGEKGPVELDDKLESEQLSAPVQIVFDDQLIPHIFAENDFDLYFAQGYVTAHHRLWQMEFQLLKTAGRLSEIFGDRALNLDRTQRRKGLVYGAEKALETVQSQPEILNMITAYTSGINYYLSKLKYKDLPIEYKLLDYAPEPWTNLKSCLLMKEMADQLSRAEGDLENTNALMLFGQEDFDFLFPDRLPGIDPVIPRNTSWDFDPIQVEKPDVNFPQIFTENIYHNPDPRNGSNSFVVAGDKTANGKVLLANEPDLSLNLPSIWYVLQLTAPGVNTYGASLPGAPGITIGFNDSIAWGNTNAKRDLVDWYMVEFRNDKREEYRYDNHWLKTQKRIEKIVVRGGDPVYDTIIYTHYGPVSYDHNFMGNSDKVNFAMKWTAHEGSKELKTLYDVNRASNYDEFVAAFENFTGPPQNYSFASMNGDIALWINGKFPIKWEGQGKFLMDGRDSRQEWQGVIPHAHNVHVKNPEHGYVSSANQHPVDTLYPYYNFDFRYEHYRNRRINDRLRLMRNVRVEDMMKLQNDNYNYRASESLPYMLDSLDTASFDTKKMQAYMLLRKWDYFNEPDRLAPSIYEEWWDNLYELLWDEFDGHENSLNRPHVATSIYILNNFPTDKFVDIRNTEEVETATSLYNKSFEMAIDSLESWKDRNQTDYNWYLYKNTRAMHLLQLDPFSFKEIKIGGNSNIVNAASGRHGPSWRMIVELGDGEINAWGVYPGSQSGNPGNPTYGSMIEPWAKGEYFPMIFMKSPEEQNERLIFRQTLQPK